MSRTSTTSRNATETLEAAMEYLTDPVAGSPSRGKKVCGVMCLHVDDLFSTGDD